ncbi:MAG: TetR/AcrR family transcriptional regulator [Anaerolineae bacterium]|jgi:AcrR family transcriptional regulator
MSPKLKPETLEKRKAHILKAALTSFARKGYHQTTMDDIVQEAGLSKGGVYWHFGSKKELFLALFESVIGGTEAVMQAALASDAISAREKLDAMLNMFVTFTTAEEFLEIMPLLIDVWAQNWQDADVNEVAVGVYNRFRQPLVQLIQEGVASGEFKPVNAKALASILFAIYDGLMVQWMIDETMVDWDAVSETVRDTLIAGLLTGKSE